MACAVSDGFEQGGMCALVASATRGHRAAITYNACVYTTVAVLIGYVVYTAL
jgi:hypothetical protein